MDACFFYLYVDTCQEHGMIHQTISIAHTISLVQAADINLGVKD